MENNVQNEENKKDYIKHTNRMYSAMNSLIDIYAGRYISTDSVSDKIKRKNTLLNKRSSYENYISTTIEKGKTDDDRLWDLPPIDDLDFSYGDVIDRTTEVIKTFYNMRMQMLSITSNFCLNASKYFNIISKRLGLVRKKQDKYEEKDVIRNYKEYYKRMMQLTKDMLYDSRFINLLIGREADNLNKVRLGKLFTKELIESKKDELVNPNLVDITNDAEATLVAAFWLNKATKLIEDCKQGYIYERTEQDIKLGLSFPSPEENKEIIAEKRCEFLNRVIKYISVRFIDNKEFEGFDLTEYFQYLYYLKNHKGDPALIKLFEIEHPEKTSFYEQKEIREFTNELSRFEERYNGLFALNRTVNDYTFLNDMQTVAAMHDCQKNFYDAKSELSTITMATLIMSDRSNSFTKYSRRWGVVEDKRADEDNRSGYILVVDLPGYLKPISLHIENQIYDVFLGLQQLKKYDGLFVKNDDKLENAFSSNVVYKANNQEKSQIKKIGTDMKNRLIKEKNNLARIEDPDEKKRQQLYLLTELNVYRILREICACSLNEHNKWLEPDKNIDTPIGE